MGIKDCLEIIIFNGRGFEWVWPELDLPVLKEFLCPYFKE